MSQLSFSSFDSSLMVRDAQGRYGRTFDISYPAIG